MHQVPILQGKTAYQLRSKLRKHRTFTGTLNYKNIQSLPVLESLRGNLSDKHRGTHALLSNTHTFIVDSGCSCSCSPHKEDFENLTKLDKPITLHGVTGETTCTEGGTLKLQTINEKGNVVTIRTPGYYNPNQTVRLFSP